ncbi:MAG: UDP-2,3-diacylglucosamine diphosphatase LpxI [Rhodobacteraceae bacterium]|nr:UDP-2,3-diacylglucosamine diphosphatase LpxI [Paracoccaceae bacterium]
MSGGLAVIAGSGALPAAVLAANHGAWMVRVEGVEAQNPGAPEIGARFEELGRLFDDLRAEGIDTVCLAGAMRRPALDPMAFDPKMRALAPRLAAAMQGGDDALLRLVVAIFEEEGFAVRGAHELVPGLVAGPGLLAGQPPDRTARDDAHRATAILAALGPLDVGQACVVGSGLCLGIETIQGTDALLEQVARTDPALRRGARGVLVKRPKPGQDLRVDMPAIGPGTVRGAAAAGLAGIVVAAGSVLILDREDTLAAAGEAGLFLLAQ